VTLRKHVARVGSAWFFNDESFWCNGIVVDDSDLRLTSAHLHHVHQLLCYSTQLSRALAQHARQFTDPAMLVLFALQKTAVHWLKCNRTRGCTVHPPTKKWVKAFPDLNFSMDAGETAKGTLWRRNVG